MKDNQRGPTRYLFLVDEEGSGERIDAFLSGHIPELSRSRIQKSIRSGELSADGVPVVKPSRRVHHGERVELVFVPPRPLDLEPAHIPLDILYEDDGLIVLNKPAGMVVHPSPGHEKGTLVHALLAHCRNLSGIGGVLRPGIVHRLDAGTTGLLVAAKSDEVHIALSRQLMERRVERMYRAIVWGKMKHDAGTIDLPIGRSPRDRKKMAVVSEQGREAVTAYYVLDTFGPFQYITLKLGTGRTHQIRVHLSHVGNPILGDPVYGGRKVRRGTLSKGEIELAERTLSLIERQALHAGELSFVHPASGERMRFEAPLPRDMQSVLDLLGSART
jgi:23S rRNA pseudouridine1911/1915/1917 synthase